ncbi:RHS repeat-associated core domain-containing protein [Chitinibacter sp. GC72]|uniref:RHS repeat-associated core domain-containing protein n=1 Tax=Chitinibacter sp. GC72 TaxID=1526917 RepID=UPI0012F86D77|nr:RHS repeat-associated core domain-containing protein [Chitinibacter sp. GC72]
MQTYSNAGRLIQSVKGNTTVTYRYNALGQRVSKTSGGVTSYFVYDTAGHLLGEYYTDGKAIQETVWLGDSPVAVVKPTADPANPQIGYIWADHLNTPRQISDPASQAILWRWDGEPFGADLANENPSGKGQYVYNLRFPGQYFDKETGKHYNYYRDYDPATGRYVQSDPIGLAGGINTYAYVGGDPIGYTDPLGLDRQATGPAVVLTDMGGGKTTFYDPQNPSSYLEIPSRNDVTRAAHAKNADTPYHGQVTYCQRGKLGNPFGTAKLRTTGTRYR